MPTLFVAVNGLISIQASTHFFSAFGSACPAAVSFTSVPVVRIRPGWPSTGIPDEACTTEIPVTSEVICTVQELVAPPAAYPHVCVTGVPGPDRDRKSVVSGQRAALGACRIIKKE